MLIPILMNIAIALGLAGFAKWKVPTWKKRAFGTRDFKWNLIITISTVLSFVASTLGFYFSGNPWIGAVIGLLAFLVTLSSVIDIALFKLPSEMTTIVQWLPVPLIILFWPSFDYMDKLSMGLWGIIVFIFAVLSFLRFFGWGDVKLMFAFGTLLSWWVGPTNMLYAFFGAAVLTLLAMPITKMLKVDFSIKKTLNEQTVWNSDLSKNESIEVLPSDIPVELSETESTPEKKAKKKTFLPFGPGLLVSFLIMALWASATVSVETYTWFANAPL